MNARDLLAERLAKPVTEAPLNQYTSDLVEGVVAHWNDINELLSTYSQGWTLERMPSVDRAILRLGAFEVLYATEVPENVAIAEAVELAKSLSTDDSPKFVNGLLGPAGRGQAHPGVSDRRRAGPPRARPPTCRVLAAIEDAGDAAASPRSWTSRAGSRVRRRPVPERVDRAGVACWWPRRGRVGRASPRCSGLDGRGATSSRSRCCPPHGRRGSRCGAGRARCAGWSPSTGSPTGSGCAPSPTSRGTRRSTPGTASSWCPSRRAGVDAAAARERGAASACTRQATTGRDGPRAGLRPWSAARRVRDRPRPLSVGRYAAGSPHRVESPANDIL